LLPDDTEQQQWRTRRVALSSGEASVLLGDEPEGWRARRGGCSQGGREKTRAPFDDGYEGTPFDDGYGTGSGLTT